MIKESSLDHIGLACTDVEAAAAWYQQVLGFKVIGKFGKRPVYFLEKNGTVYEIFQQELPEALQGKIDHISFGSDDIEADYDYCVKQGYSFATNGIQSIPHFWEHGIRYFKILSPTGEQVEFCQKL